MLLRCDADEHDGGELRQRRLSGCELRRPCLLLGTEPREAMRPHLWKPQALNCALSTRERMDTLVALSTCALPMSRQQLVEYDGTVALCGLAIALSRNEPPLLR